MLREKLVIFAWGPKLEWATMTLFLTSAPKFLWLVVNFDEKCPKFYLQEKIVSAEN